MLEIRQRSSYPVEKTDETDLMRVSESDHQVFAELYNQYADMLYGYLYGHIQDTTVAEDLTHDTFERAFRAFVNGHDIRENFNSWLFSIAHNLYVSHVRREQRRPIEALNEYHPSVISTSHDIGLGDEYDELRRAFELLPPRYQDVLRLRFEEDLSHSQVGEVVGTTQGGSKLVQHRAILKLRGSLIEEEV